MKKKYEAIGLWVSSGAPTIGVERELNVIAHFSDGKFGYETRQENWPKMREWTEPDIWPMHKYENIDFMYCAPPCAPFSKLGKRGTDWEKDEKIKKADACLTAGLIAQPKIWLMESVPAFYTKGQGWWQDAEQKWLSRGYSVTYFTTGSVLHGAPQIRLRWHMIAHKVELVFPDPQYGPRTLREGLKFYGVERDSLQAKHPPKLGPLYRHTPVGGRFRTTFMWMAGIREPDDRGLFRGIPGMAYRRLRWDASVPVITGSPRQFMPEEPRLYSVGEGKAICGFPHDFRLVGSAKEQYALVGRCIMPPVAEYLGKMARLSLEQGKRLRGPRTYVVDHSPLAYTERRKNELIAKMPQKLWDTKPEWRVEKNDPYRTSWYEYTGGKKSKKGGLGHLGR